MTIGLALASAVLVGGCGGSATRVATTPTSLSASLYRGGGLTARLPSGWHVARQRLTAVSSPVQRLVLTSFVLHQRVRDTGCRPDTALHKMPAAGAMVYVFEYRGPTAHDLAREPPRPQHFRLDPRSLRTYECLGRSYMVRFRDHGRALQAHVYLGRRAGAPARRQALAVLDSLRVRRASPRAAAVWVPPRQVLTRTPDLGVACPQANHFACDRVGLAVWLRTPALGVAATIDGRPVTLHPQWNGTAQGGRRRMFAGFLHPAGLLRGPLTVHADDGPGRWIGRRSVEAGVGLMIERSPTEFVRTSLRVRLAPGWG